MTRLNKRCKFGEWCSFNHIDNNDNRSSDDIKVIFERIEDLSKIIAEKDNMIKELAEKIEKLEKHNNDHNETGETENIVDDELDINTTFINPYHAGFPCEVCEFIAKSKGGLTVHMKAKHKENTEDPEIVVVDTLEIIQESLKSEEIQRFKCEKFEFLTDNSRDFECHNAQKHDVLKIFETNEVKLFSLIQAEN